MNCPDVMDAPVRRVAILDHRTVVVHHEPAMGEDLDTRHPVVEDRTALGGLAIGGRVARPVEDTHPQTAPLARLEIGHLEAAPPAARGGNTDQVTDDQTGC